MNSDLMEAPFRLSLVGDKDGVHLFAHPPEVNAAYSFALSSAKLLRVETVALIAALQECLNSEEDSEFHMVVMEAEGIKFEL